MRTVTETRYIADLVLPTNTPKSRDVETKYGTSTVQTYDLKDSVVMINGDKWEFNVWAPKNGKPKITLQRWANNSKVNEQVSDEIV